MSKTSHRQSVETCQICDREAVFICGDCKMAKYCTSEHRTQNWRIHKQQCKVVKKLRERQMEESVSKSRMEIRKHFFQNYSHKIYDRCIVIARELFQLEKNHIKVTKEIFNEFQYGVAVCLLCRTYLLIDRKRQAKQEMDNYIRDKLHFLEDMRNIPTIKQTKKFTTLAKQFLEKKLTLISSVANIYHELKENCIKYYSIYTNHIELVYGAESYELSNAYFCVGCYYKEINEVTKAIACFVKSATIRGKKGGDCFVNISLLYRRQGKIYAALDMMSNAVKLNEEEYGSSSGEIAEVYEKLGLLYLDIRDFNSSIVNLQNALKIYINQKQSDNYERVKEKISILYKKLQETVQTQKSTKDKKILKNKEQEQNKMDLLEQKRGKQQILVIKNMQLEKIFKISDIFLNRLNPMEIFRLSELQLQLEECRSEFAVAYTVGNSDFLKKLSDNRKRELKSQNQKLFELINVEKRLKTGHQETE